jgi:pimeloyl-ACP methyl ester carboxylesterase
MPRCRHALLLHGAGGGGWEWNAWHGVFAAHGIEVSAPDLAAVPAGLAATQWPDYLEQARQALAVLPRPRAVVGASLGGLLAFACADLADALVLVNPLPPAPWAAGLPMREWPDLVPWGRQARLDGTRRALGDADPATALYAFRRWRDESGPVLRQAHAGLALSPPTVPTLMVVSAHDEDVPPPITRDMAAALGAQLLETQAGSHVGPLLGRVAPQVAGQVARWLSDG